MKSPLLFLTMLALWLTLGGCSTADPTPTVPTEPEENISVLMYDNWYGENNNNQASPPTWQVTSGKLVALEMTNKGNVKHNWAIIRRNAIVPYPFDAANPDHQALILFDSQGVGSKETTTVTFVAPEPGRYQIICTIIAHYPGMQGVLDVKAP